MRAVVVNETAGSTVTVADTVESLSRFALPIPVFGLTRKNLPCVSKEIEQIADMLQFEKVGFRDNIRNFIQYFNSIS